MRILIVEEALQRDAGHWPVYLGDIAAGCRDSGDTVDLLAHREADPSLLSRLQAVPWLSRSCWSDPAAQGQLGGLRHALRFSAELRRWLKHQASNYDWICSLTMRLPHLLSYTLLIRSNALPIGTRCLLLFVQGFGEYVGPNNQPVRFPDSISNRLARWCFRRLRHAVLSGRVMLAAETEAMCKELALFSGLPIELFPHPVELPAVSRARANSCTSADNSSVTIICPGFARYEKGVDLIQTACRNLWQMPSYQAVRMICQWPEPFALPDGSMLSADPVLASDPRFNLINHNLDADQYDNILTQSDLILLPYRRSSYHNRVSRVAIEAAIRGIPLIVTSGTWAEDLTSLATGSVLIQEETAASVLAALIQAVDQLERLRASAACSADAVRSFHSVARFRSLLAA